jgi:hypothetical protein
MPCPAMSAAICRVYLHEIADPRYKAVTGSLGYISLGIGVVIGILVVAMVTSVIPNGECRRPVGLGWPGRKGTCKGIS